MVAPKFNLPAVKSEKAMANKFLGVKSSKTVKFLDLDLQINKLSINQVIRVQTITRAAEAAGDELGGIQILSAVIREGASELAELTQEELQDFPMEALTILSGEIMEFSGLNPKGPVAV
jgi:hypothetical protein